MPLERPPTVEQTRQAPISVEEIVEVVRLALVTDSSSAAGQKVAIQKSSERQSRQLQRTAAKNCGRPSLNLPFLNE